MRHNWYRNYFRLFQRHGLRLGIDNRLRINARRRQQLWHSRLQFVRRQHFHFARIVEHRYRLRHGWRQWQWWRYVGWQQQWQWRHVGWRQRQQIIRQPVVARPEKVVGRLVMRCIFYGVPRCALLPSPLAIRATLPSPCVSQPSSCSPHARADTACVRVRLHNPTAHPTFRARGGKAR